MRLPIGISDFSKLSAGVHTPQAYTFVDKTLLVRDFIQEGAEVVLWTRPRRFGKTLNLSMLYYFFSCNEKKKQDLFKDLKIKKTGETYLQHQGQYPVIFLSFKDIKKTNFTMGLEHVRAVLSECYRSYQYLLEGNTLSENEQLRFKNVLERTATQTVLEESLKQLSVWLSTYHKKKTIILIDEYDTPIHAAYVNGYYQEMIDLMRGLLSAALKDNTHLHKAAVTGILRVAKENIFSGLNNPAVYSFLDKQYRQYFGFTEVEVANLFQLALHFQAKN